MKRVLTIERYEDGKLVERMVEEVTDDRTISHGKIYFHVAGAAGHMSNLDHIADELERSIREGPYGG